MVVEKENYKLYNGDCLEIMSKIEDNSIDLIVTDPPYKLTSRGSSGNTGGMLQKKIIRQGKVFKHNDIEIKDFMPELYRVLKENTHCYIMTNHVNLIEMLNVARECGFHFIKSLIWNKGNKIMGQCYMSQYEYILFFRKGKHKKINNCGTSDILDIPNKKTKDENGKNLHDTEKPVELMKILVENSSDAHQNNLILDPFMGIGSTGIATLQLEGNRKFIGIELDKQYFDIAKERISNAVQKDLKDSHMSK